MHQLDVVNQCRYVHLKGITDSTLAYASSLSPVFRAKETDDPVITMKIEGDDPEITPYASCRTAELSLHTDYATFAAPPRYTITHCIKPDPRYPEKGKSIILLLEPVLEHLRRREQALLKLLTSARFPFRRNAEHAHYHSHIPTFPILTEDWQVRFDQTLILPALDDMPVEEGTQLREAVQTFVALCQEHAERIEFALDTHEVLIIDNRRVLHSRGECTLIRTSDGIISREVNLAFLE